MAARRALPLAGTLAVATLLAGCGGGDAADARAGSGSAEAFVTPRDTDILLADLSWDASGMPSVGRPTNLTQRPDYDNQPCFVPDGSGLWYTANDPQSGQADIWRYDFASRRVVQVTMSAPESEYSATPLPDGTGISTIRVEADSTQRLWRFDGDGSDGSVLLPDVAPVGYHAWSGDSTLVMFVLGTPATLQRAVLGGGAPEVIASDIGRSIQSIPGSTDVSYVQLGPDGTSTIMRLPGDGGAPEPIIEGVAGGDYHAWGPSGVLLQASGSVLYAVMPGPGATWSEVADFSDLHLSLSRLAVSPDGTQIAMVAEAATPEGFAGN